MSSSGWHRKKNTAADQARRAQYDSPEHRAIRAQYKELVEAGLAKCWRCGVRLPPGSKWHAGHDDADRRIYKGTECPPCNLKAAASKGARVANARRRQPPKSSRDW